MNPLENKDWRIGGIFFIVSLSLYVAFMSNNLEDWDSVQYALAIHDFDIRKHQPHPPGYPTYVMMARLMHPIARDDALTLTLLSALFGALSITFTHLLTTQLFDSRTAILAAILLLFNPTHFLFSIVAMNDVVSLAFIVMSAVLLLEGEENTAFLTTGALITGLGLGVRPQNALVFIPIYCFVFFRTDGPGIKFGMLLSSMIGVLLWLAPTVRSHGFLEFFTMGHEQFSNHENVRMNFSPYHLLVIMHLMTWKGRILFAALFLAAGAVSSGTVAKLGVINTLKKMKNGSRRSNGVSLLLLWLVIAIVTELFFYNLYISRYILPGLTPMIILLSFSAVHFYDSFSRKKAKIAISLLLAASMAYTGASTMYRARLLKTTKPASVQAALFIKGNFKKEEVGVLSIHSRRHFDYYLGGYRILRADPDVVDKNWKELLNSPNIKWIISERKLDRAETYKREFKREKAIYPKHESTTLYVYGLDENNDLKTGWKERRGTKGGRFRMQRASGSESG